MTPEEKAAVEEVRNHYKSISDKFDELLEACGDDRVLKRQLGDALQEALKNYIEAQNRILGQNSATIKKLIKAAEKAKKETDNALKDLKQIKKTLNVITKAVKTVGIVVASL